jgi:hypothetical protein
MFRGRIRRDEETLVGIGVSDGDTLQNPVPRVALTSVKLCFDGRRRQQRDLNILVRPDERVIDLKFRIWSLLQASSRSSRRVNPFLLCCIVCTVSQV